MSRGRARVSWVALAALLAVGSSADAHAFLERADPRVGSTVRSAPDKVRLWFTQRLEPAYSRVEVFDEAGQRVDLGPAALDAGERTLLTVPVPPLLSGRYRVRWRVLSLDTHVTEGDFTFTVAK